MSLITYIYLFSLTFYAAIPQAFGGGKPYFENFVVADKGKCQLQQLGIPFLREQPNVTEPLPVLHESDILVAVWLGKQDDCTGRWNAVVVQLDKTLIVASMVAPGPSWPTLKTHPVPCSAASGGQS